MKKFCPKCNAICPEFATVCHLCGRNFYEVTYTTDSSQVILRDEGKNGYNGEKEAL